ncbi:hypothetical protein OZ410_06540 [Robiginitalea sp. M366]|uniref:hypothetical protein n=1 Tax=Robiginitalea aestuariiviva TaxID=3036903 RepID=UPI00240DF3B6|nr:hypothetical protein [Robiginitalea aestuariiviva]MDG1571967.1 hypothetical protein [Robiginitalea aestuariiviva]
MLRNLTGGWAILFVLLGLSACRQPEPPVLDYEIHKAEYQGMPALEVHMTFQAPDSAVAHVQYQDEAWGEQGLFGAIRDVKLLEGEGRVAVLPDSNRVELHGVAPGSLLQLAYTVVQDQPEAEGGPDRSYRPIVTPEYFHVFSHNLFMIPAYLDTEQETPVHFRLHWSGWDQPEVVHNSFGSNQREQDLGVLTVARFHSAIFTGGDFRIYTDTIDGNALHLATRGQWVPFTDRDVMEVLSQTVRAQRRFWGDHSQRYFTVTMRPYPLDRGSSFQGTGLTNSFATSVSNNVETELDQLLYLFNHELMHNWIGHTIENEAEEAQYWFSEGFTEYYTMKNIASYGIGGKDWGCFIAYLNETIRLLETSPVREEPNSAITYENFWGNRDYEKLPYRRGMLFAFYLDQQIRAVSDKTKSLDNLMRDILQEVRQTGVRLNANLFVEKARPYLVEDLAPFFEAHIEQGVPLPLEGLLTSLGLEFTIGADVFDLGFAFDPDRSFVQSVDSASAAYATGLREGDRVVSRSIYMGSTHKEVELVVLRDGKRIPIQYFPIRRAPVLQLLDSPENQAWFSK